MKSANEPTNIQQRAVKGVAWSAVQNWGRQAISFIVFFLLARLLDPETFGLVASASIFLGFIEVFLDQGFSVAIIQRDQVESEHLNTAFWTNIGISTGMIALSIAVSGLIANFFKQPELAPIICWLSLSFAVTALISVHEAIFKRKLEFKAIAISDLVAVSIGGIVGVTMAFTGFGVWSLVCQQLANGLVKILLIWRISNWRPRLNFSYKHFRELFIFGINIVGINVFEFFNRRSDDFLIGYFLGSVALGYYSIAYRLLMIAIQLLNSVTNQVALPVFSKLQHQPDQLREGFYNVTKITSLIAFPIFFGMSVLAPELVHVLFGVKWLSSIPIIQILAFVGMLHSISFFYSTVIIAMGKPKWRLNLNFVNAITNVIGFMLGIKWGIVGVASAFLIQGYFFSTPIFLTAVHKLLALDIPKYFTQLRSSLLASTAMTICILGMKHLLKNFLSYHTALLLYTIICITVYTLLIYVLEPKLFLQAFKFLKLVLQTKTAKI